MALQLLSQGRPSSEYLKHHQGSSVAENLQARFANGQWFGCRTVWHLKAMTLKDAWGSVLRLILANWVQRMTVFVPQGKVLQTKK